LKLRYAIWAAVSTQEQARPDKYSLETQLEHCRRVAGEKGWVEASSYIVKGQSRTKDIQLDAAAKRIPELNRLLTDARAGKFDVLIMTEFDRLRELLDQVFRTLAASRVQLYSLAQPVEPVEPAQYSIYTADTLAMMIGLSQITSRIEISRTRRKWYDNMPKRITERGLPVQIPFGYRKPLDRQHDRAAIPEPDPALIPHLLAIKDQFLSGQPTSALVRYLEGEKVTPPRSDKWHAQTVRDILRNPFYAGTVRFGVTRILPDPQTGSRTRTSAPPEQVHTHAGKHIPLWDEATHQAILHELKTRTRNYRGRQNNQFTGLVKCGQCGSAMWKQGNGPRQYREIYRCSNETCHNAMPFEILLEKVAQAILALRNAPAPQKSTTPRTETSPQKASQLQTQLTRLEDAYLAGQFDLASYTDRRARLLTQLEDTQHQAAATAQQVYAQQQAARQLKQLAQLHDLPHWLSETDPLTVNHTLRQTLHAIHIHTDRIELEHI
jgi:DNA invertase Pin-like site-specific DNA recombinase